MDYLRVDAVKMIYDGYRNARIPLPSVDELLDKIRDDKEVWKLFEHGFTICLNQCEKEKTTRRVMTYKPKNVVELAAFVAAVRPGFKSMLDTYVNRRPFRYGIPSLDKILATKEIPDSFLMYDEQILSILQTAGIDPADAYACIKAIKKKKSEKVKAYGVRFKEGFSSYLTENENATPEEAADIVSKIWTIINDAASYMFCSAHAFSMACDNLYCAWLKAHYPYEFYATILKLYDEKGNKEKIAQIIEEMKRYQNISLRLGSFSEDNRDWYINKENHAISQSLSSIKFISRQIAEELYEAGQHEFATFTSLLRYLQQNTHVNTKQIEILICLNYFAPFGETGKLYQIFKTFNEGNDSCKRITKTLTEKSLQQRLKLLEDYESQLPQSALHPVVRLRYESENTGLCFTSNRLFDLNLYFISDVDDQYGVKVKIYNIQTGIHGTVRMKKDVYENKKLQKGDMVRILSMPKRPHYNMVNGKPVADRGKMDYWLNNFDIVPLKPDQLLYEQKIRNIES